jgi:predicted ATPase
MLTRLEVNGFKNLIDFSIDFGPLTCIAGPNGVGKSNIFDAIEFLSLLADNTLIEAALKLRGATKDTADVGEIFWTNGTERAETFTIAAEMIVPSLIRDDFGREAEASSTFLRYELEVGYERPEGRTSLGRLVLRREALRYIPEGESVSKLGFHHAPVFRKSVINNKRRTKTRLYISTETTEDGYTEILVHQEGNAGRPQRAPAESAPRTVIATTNTSTTPTILAARREMQSWRILALEPSAMRAADRFQDDPHVTPSGRHLPATLFRMAGDKSLGDKIYSRVTAKLSDLVPIKMLAVDKDDVRQLLVLQAVESTGAVMPAKSLSDGTLRFLTLSIISEDPEAQGLICMEEPENGIHPAKLEHMVELLRDLVVDPTSRVDTDNPLRQLIIATHSPGIVQLQNSGDLLFALNVLIRDSSGRIAETIRCRPLFKTWRSKQEDQGIGMGTILAYLTAPPGAQLRLTGMEEA